MRKTIKQLPPRHAEINMGEFGYRDVESGEAPVDYVRHQFSQAAAMLLFETIVAPPDLSELAEGEGAAQQEGLTQKLDQAIALVVLGTNIEGMSGAPQADALALLRTSGTPTDRDLYDFYAMATLVHYQRSLAAFAARAPSVAVAG